MWGGRRWLRLEGLHIWVDARLLLLAYLYFGYNDLNEDTLETWHSDPSMLQRAVVFDESGQVQAMREVCVD